MRYCLILIIYFFIQPALAASFVLHTESQEPLYQTQLSKQVYQHSRSDQLQDLTIQNDDGESVPYALVTEAILHPQKLQKTLKDLTVFPIEETRLAQADALKIELGRHETTTNVSINTEQNNPDSHMVYLVDLGEKHNPYKNFTADWQGQQNQLIQLDLYTSDDLKNWQKNGQAVLLNTDNPSNIENLVAAKNNILQNTLTLDTTTTARYLQIKPLNLQTDKPFSLTKLSAETVAPSVQNPTLIWQEIPLVNRNEDTKKALIQLDFEATGHYPASYLKITLPQDNTITSALIRVRNSSDAPWTIVAQAPLYRISRNGATVINPAIEITPTTARFWQLQFSQAAGGIGRENAKLSLGWPPATVIWNARGKAPFNLQIGEHPKSINQVAISNLLASDKTADFKTTDLATLPKATLQTNDSTAPSNTWQTPVNYQRYLLWSGLVLGVGLLACMAYSLFKSNNKTKETA